MNGPPGNPRNLQGHKTFNEYKWSFRGTCPVDNGSDKYWATLVTDGFIEVEKLIAFCEERKNKPIFQEDHAKDLCAAFGGIVTLIGYHRGGVRIQSTAQ